MWRRPIEQLEAERNADGQLSVIPVALDCGHVLRGASFRKSDGEPRARQWCAECESVDVRALAEETACGWLEDGATGNAPGLELADYLEVAIDNALKRRGSSGYDAGWRAAMKRAMEMTVEHAGNQDDLAARFAVEPVRKR